MRFKALDVPITPLLFHTRFEVIFLSSSARGLEWFRSSYARGLKLILVKRYFYPFLHEVLTSCWKLILLSSSARSPKLTLKWWFSHLTGLTLDCQSCFVPVLHLQANQTWFCFGLILESHMSTYLDLSLTASLVMLWLCHAYLLDWSYNSDANRKGFKSSLVRI